MIRMAGGSVRKLKGGKERGRRFRDMIASAAAVILFALLLTSCAVKKQPDSIPAGKPVNENTRDGTGLMTIDTEPKTDWKAEWIWDRTDGTEENTWVVFRDTFTLEKVPETLRAYVSADSKYWLFVNGVNVIYEGGLKRGPDGNSGYYDTADKCADYDFHFLTPLFKFSVNIINDISCLILQNNNSAFKLLVLLFQFAGGFHALVEALSECLLDFVLDF